MESSIDMSIGNQDSEEILRDAGKPDYDLQLSPIFSSRLKPFGGFPLTPTITLNDHESSPDKELSLSLDDAILGTQMLDTAPANDMQYETPATCVMLPLSVKKLKKKHLKPVDYTVRPSCKRLQLTSLSGSNGSSRPMVEKKRKINTTKKEVTKGSSKSAMDGSVVKRRAIGSLAECSSKKNIGNGDVTRKGELAACIEHENVATCSRDNGHLRSPLAAVALKWSPLSGCSPLSDSSSCCDGVELRPVDAFKTLSDAMWMPRTPRVVTSTPVDNEVMFDYNVSAITEGCGENTCGPFILEESRFCISSDIMVSETYSQCVDEWPNSDKENVDPDWNRAAFDAFLKSRRLANAQREDKLKCTFKRVGSNSRPLEELIRIHFSASQPACPPLQLEIDDGRLSHSQPESRRGSGKSTLLPSGFDIVESMESALSRTENGNAIDGMNGRE